MASARAQQNHRQVRARGEGSAAAHCGRCIRRANKPLQACEGPPPPPPDCPPTQTHLGPLLRWLINIHALGHACRRCAALAARRQLRGLQLRAVAVALPDQARNHARSRVVLVQRVAELLLSLKGQQCGEERGWVRAGGRDLAELGLLGLCRHALAL